MRLPNRVVVVTTAVLLSVSPVLAEVIGSGTANPSGAGSILVEVDPTIDPDYVRQQILDNVRLPQASGAGEAKLSEVLVENGTLTISFEDAEGSALVEAVLDDEIAGALKGTGAGGGAVGGLGASGFGLAAGGALVVGGIVGGLAASGAFDDDGDDSDAAAPPVVPPGPAPVAPTPVPRRADDDPDVPSPSQ